MCGEVDVARADDVDVCDGDDGRGADEFQNAWGLMSFLQSNTSYALSYTRRPYALWGRMV